MKTPAQPAVSQTCMGDGLGLGTQQKQSSPCWEHRPCPPGEEAVARADPRQSQKATCPARPPSHPMSALPQTDPLVGGGTPPQPASSGTKHPSLPRLVQVLEDALFWGCLLQKWAMLYDHTAKFIPITKASCSPKKSSAIARIGRPVAATHCEVGLGMASTSSFTPCLPIRSVLDREWEPVEKREKIALT